MTLGPRHIAGFGGVFIAAIVALSGYDIYRSYQKTLEDTGRELDAHARVIAEQTARSMQAIDVVLRHLAEESRRGALAGLSEAQLHAYLREQSIGLVQVDGLVVVQASGEARAASHVFPLPEPRPSVSSFPEFQALREKRDLGLVIGPAWRSEVDGAWVFPLARRIETPSGEFAGAASARGKIDYFQHFYRAVQLEPGTAVALIHRNGTLMARHPPAEAALGKQLPMFDEMVRTRTARAVSSVDGVDRLGALELVADYPLAVIVTREATSALAGWRAQSLRTAARTLGLALLAVVLLVLLMRQFSRLYKTSRSLEVTKERYALAVAGSDDGIWEYDFTPGRAFASARARELSGLPPGPEDEAIDAFMQSLPVHPDDRSVRTAALEAHLAGRTAAYEGEWRIRGADGFYRWVRVHGLCIRDASGKPHRMAGSISDIDARKRAEDALRASEERYALAVAGADEGIWDYDFVTGQVFASARARELSGRPPGPEIVSIDEWLNSLVIHPDDAPRRLAAREAHLSGKAPAYEGEWRMRRPDGSYRWVRLHGLCLRDASGKPYRMAGSITDIDDRKRAEEALRASEARYALAVAGSDEGIWDYDFSAGKVFTSARARELLGLAPGGPETQPLGGWAEGLPIHPDDKKVWQAAREAHLSGQTPAFQGEWRMRRPDGGYRWVRVRGLCVRDAAGKPTRMAGSVTDIDARKRAEEALRESQERYALAVAGSDDGIWDFDFVHRKVFGSARARELCGLPPGIEVDPMDEWFARLPIHPEDAPYRLAAMQAHLDGKTPAYEGEYRMRQADGHYRWVRIHGLCIRDAAGKPVRMAGSVSDIDDRKRAEEALRASEERFALAVAGSNDGIFDWDIVHDRIYTSKRAMEIFDIDSDVTVRTHDDWRRLVRHHPDDQSVRQEFEHFLGAGPDLHDVEYRILLKDGGVRWVRHRHICVRAPNGKALRLTGSVSDIDAQKRAEEGLRASEEHYRSIFNAAADALVLRDAEARVVDVNPAFLQISGYTREEVINGTRWIFALPEMAELAKDMHRRCIAGETVRFEMKARRKDGTLIDIEMRAVPIRYRGQQHALGMARDITAQKRAEAERLRLEGQLLQAKKLEAIGTLAGGIAHDFNNILSATLGYGEMAQKAAPAGTALRRHIDAVVSAGMRAKSLVERILAFSRSGMGERVPVHVQSVVDEALDLLAASLPAHVRLDRALAAGDAAVMGDPTQIHQVVMNLCANAAQAMKSPGSLTVALDVVEKSRSRVATSELAEGRYLRLRVRDTGSGIAPNVLERIFDPFFTTKGAGVGTGLGLSLVHGIVTDLGGGIDVESELGKGTTFTVYLPWSDAVAAPAGEEEALAQGAGETVLLVDDEESLVRLGEEMIASLGYEPVGFASSNAALAAFRADPERFSAVLTDESMPEMTGCELAEQIRRLRPELPIVLMTGFVHPGLAARAESLGVRDVLAKPLVARDIARALAGALAQEQVAK